MLGLYISTLSDLKMNSIESRLGETSRAVQHRIDFEAAAGRRRAPGHVAAWETSSRKNQQAEAIPVAETFKGSSRGDGFDTGCME